MEGKEDKTPIHPRSSRSPALTNPHSATIHPPIDTTDEQIDNEQMIVNPKNPLEPLVISIR